MVYRIVWVLVEDETSSAADGVPCPTGVEFTIETLEDRVASKLLEHVDGVRSLRQLLDDMPLPTRQFAEAVCRLYDLGAIAFDQDFCDRYLVADGERPSAARLTPKAPRSVSNPPPRVTPTTPRRATPAPPPPTEATVPEGKAAGDQVSIEIVEQADIAEIPLWQKFNQLERKLFTGRVVTSSKGCRREFYFLNGTLTYATSDGKNEEIGHLMKEKQKLTQAQYDAYRREMSRPGADPYAVLIELGAFPSHQKLMAQRWAAQTAAYNVLLEREGSFVVEKWDRLSHNIPKLGLNVKGIMVRFMQEALPVDEEAEKLKDKMDWWLLPITDQIDRSLSDKEARMWAILQERPRRLRDLMTLTTMFKKDTYRFILTLLTGGFAEMTKSPPQDEGPIDLRTLDDACESMMEANYFDTLTVHPVSDFEDIRKSHEKLLPKFDLAAYKQLTEDQKAKLLKMKEKVEAAWNVLKTDASRREYREKTFTEYQLRQYAMLQYQKAEIYLWWRRDSFKAREYFGSSMDLDPDNPLYWGAYAYSTITLPNPDSKAYADAIRLAERIAGSGTDDATALVFAGGTLLRAGRHQPAEALLAKARALSAGGADSMITMVTAKGKKEEGP
jgi:hypothetical protein